MSEYFTNILASPTRAVDPMIQAHKAIPTSSNNKRIGVCFGSFELTMLKGLFA
jgi:hypothetical protein